VTSCIWRHRQPRATLRVPPSPFESLRPRSVAVVGGFEDELGLALFERGRGGVRLTSGGKAVLPHIRRALAELDAIRHAGDQNGTGTVGEVRLGVRVPPTPR
jgi:hypothetical protein